MTDNDTKMTLDHYFAQKVGGVRVMYELDSFSAEKATAAQGEFVSALERMLERVAAGTMQLSPGIGEEELRQIQEIAQRDWTKPQTILDLYENHGAITGVSYGSTVLAQLYRLARKLY